MVALVCALRDAGSGLQFLHFLVGEFAVLWEFFNVEIYAVFQPICAAFVLQFAYQRNHLLNIVCCARVVAWRFDAECCVVGVVLWDNALCQVCHGDFFFISAFDHFVIDVRYVERKIHGVAGKFQKSAHDVKGNGAASMPQMRVVINRWAANVHCHQFACLASCVASLIYHAARFKRLFFSSEAVVDFDHGDRCYGFWLDQVLN